MTNLPGTCAASARRIRSPAAVPVRRMPPLATAAVVAIALMAGTAVAQPVTDAAAIDRGRYLVLIGHCNNCHTAGYIGRQGQTPEKDWLLGNPLGFRTAVGTTYASNLRLTTPNFSEDQWVQYAKNVKLRPPMPWWSLHDTRTEDLRAMYRFIRQLGAAGQPAPEFIAPDREPPRP